LRRAGDERSLARQFEQFKCHLRPHAQHQARTLIARATTFDTVQTEAQEGAEWP
jgi:hypothetical protein